MRSRREASRAVLVILMYHRVGDVSRGAGNSVADLERHFRYLRDHAVVMLPGEALSPRRLNVCLTFDDAYADFYVHVFPLLRDSSLRAVLGVPTRFILDETALSPEVRLEAAQSGPMSGEVFRTHAPFCTWAELREMQASGLVQIASHSHSHSNMQGTECDVEFEAAHSQALIEEKLGRRPPTFIYPHGGVNARARRAVLQHYEFDVRIGTAINRTWKPRHQPLCRVTADHTPDLAALLRWNSLACLGMKMLVNQVRATLGKWR